MSKFCYIGNSNMSVILICRNSDNLYYICWKFQCIINSGKSELLYVRILIHLNSDNSNMSIIPMHYDSNTLEFQ